ncbi:MAG: GAF domain-containing protein [Polyangiales bacterium]
MPPISEALLRVALLLTAELDLGRLVGRITDEATALCGAGFGAFFYNVEDAAGERYTLYTLSGVPREAFARFPMPRNTAVFAPTFEGRAVVRSDDITRDPRYGHNAPHRGMPEGHLPVRSYLAVPVTSRAGEVIGGLFFGHPEPARFTPYHEELIRGLAAHAAIAVDNARLYQQARRAEELARAAREVEARRAREAGLRADTAAAVTRGGPLQEMLGQCVEAIVVRLGAAFARVWTLDPAGAWLELQASAGRYTHLDGPHARVPVGSFKIGLIAQERAAHLTNDVLHDPRVSDHAWARREGMVAFAGYPLCIEGRLLGVVAAFAREPLGQEALDLLASTADLIALGIDRTRGEEARRRAEAEAAVERARLLRVFEQAPAAIAITRGPEHVTETVNAAYRQLIGAREVLGRRVGKAFPEPELQGFVALLDRVYATGEPVVGREVPARYDHDGEKVEGFFNFVYQPLTDAGGAVQGIMTFAVNVTDLVHARQRVTESEEQLRALVENLPELAWSARADGHIDYYNRRWYDYTGTTFEEMQGWGWERVHDPSLLPRVVELWRRSLETGEPFEMEFPLRGVDGEFRWFLTRVLPMRGPDGRVVRWFGTNTNIQALKRAEAEREQLIAALAASNAELDQFAYVASHDLKAPLRAIASLSSWIEEDLADHLTGETRANFDLLRGRVQRLERLIDGILSYSRAGRVREKVERVEVAALVGEAIDLLAPTPPAAVRVVGELPAVMAERVAVQQVFMNLIANALKHGGPAVHVEVSARDAGARWEFSVADDGPGIEAQFHDRIWGIFQTLAPRDRVESTGVGLSIVKKVVETRGGRVSVQSAPGKGSTFSFTWPKIGAPPT